MNYFKINLKGMESISSVPVRGEQKTAVGEGKGEEGPPSPSPAAVFCSPRTGMPAMQVSAAVLGPKFAHNFFFLNHEAQHAKNTFGN